jgi:hypothetical protein
VIKAQKDRVIVYPNSSHKRTVKRENLTKRHSFKCGVSDKVKAKIFEIVESWSETIEISKIINGGLSLKFITLTIPAVQRHCDKSIVSKCLLPFLKSLGYYLYVCEKQKNGNIHFHILSDTNDSAKILRSTWNTCLEKLGYISDYKEDREEFFKNGFVFQDNGFSLVQQQIWYSFGVQTSWTNPHTLDFKKVDDIAKCSAYITKYMVKSSENVLCCHLWGAHRRIKLLETPKVKDSPERSNDIDFLRACASDVINVNEFVQIIRVKGLRNILPAYSTLLNDIQKHFLFQYEALYL